MMRAAMAPKTDSLGPWFLQFALTFTLCARNTNQYIAWVSIYSRGIEHVKTDKEILLNDKLIFKLTKSAPLQFLRKVQLYLSD